jgi:hypothetical protein
VDEQFRAAARELAQKDETPTSLAGDAAGRALVTAGAVVREPAPYARAAATAGALETLGAVAGTLATIPVPESRVCRVSATVVGRRSGNGDALATELAATFKRSGAAAPTQVGATTVVAAHADAGAGAWAVVFDVFGTAVRVRVTGDGTTPVRWVGDIRAASVG